METFFKFLPAIVVFIGFIAMIAPITLSDFGPARYRGKYPYGVYGRGKVIYWMGIIIMLAGLALLLLFLISGVPK